jgi:hypothetical protein
MNNKRPFLDIADLIITVGVILLLVGAYLLDWRLTLVVGGMLLIAVGAARLHRVEGRSQ